MEHWRQKTDKGISTKRQIRRRQLSNRTKRQWEHQKKGYGGEAERLQLLSRTNVFGAGEYRSHTSSGCFLPSTELLHAVTMSYKKLHGLEPVCWKLDLNANGFLYIMWCSGHSAMNIFKPKKTVYFLPVIFFLRHADAPNYRLLNEWYCKLLTNSYILSYKLILLIYKININTYRITFWSYF